MQAPAEVTGREPVRARTVETAGHPRPFIGMI